MHQEVEKLLRETFGFEALRPGQREIIDHLMDGTSALAVFPTGAGKSLCYQLPALTFDGMTLVVSPLIALMKDQIDFLASKGVAAARLDSSLSAEDARMVWQALRERGDLTLKVAGVRRGYRFVQRLDTPDELIRGLRDRFQGAEERDIARIAQVVGLGVERDCIVRHVLAYFGEDLGRDCGHCDRCLNEPRSLPPEVVDPIPNEEDRALLRVIIREGHAPLRSARQLARFFCGLASPATIRAKLTRDDRFGALAHLRFRTVLKTANDLLEGSSER